MVGLLRRPGDRQRSAFDYVATEEGSHGDTELTEKSALKIHHTLAGRVKFLLSLSCLFYSVSQRLREGNCMIDPDSIVL